MSKSGSKIREQVAHFFVDIHRAGAFQRRIRLSIKKNYL